MGELQINRAMEPLEKNVDIDKIINFNFDGQFTNLDPEQEEVDLNVESLEIAQDTIQPKVIKETTAGPKVVKGLPLQLISHVQPKEGIAIADFFEKLF